MSLDDDMAILGQVSMFEGFNADQIRLLAFGAETLFIKAGTEIYLQNAISDCGYVVFNGMVDLTIQLPEGERILTSVESGGLLGELALISDNARATNAIARRDSRVLKISRDLFLRMLEKYPESAYELHQKILRSVRATVLQLSDIDTRLRDPSLTLDK